MCRNIVELTELKIFPAKKENSNLLAFCIATFNESLIVSGIRIKEGKKGVYVTFPITTGTDGKMHPVVYPASGEARKEICNRILASYVVNHCADDYQV